MADIVIDTAFTGVRRHHRGSAGEKKATGRFTETTVMF
jgi:hypothetical protein